MFRRMGMMVLAMVVAPGLVLAHGGHDHGTNKKAPWAPRADATGTYGTKSKASVTPVTLETLFSATDKYKGKLIRVEGVIKTVCKVKGCWMMIEQGNRKMRVRFKGYKFFMPTNSEGYKAVAYGYARKAIIPVRVLRHYAMDRGDVEGAKKITKPKVTVAFTADWVELSKVEKAAASTKPAARK